MDESALNYLRIERVVLKHCLTLRSFEEVEDGRGSMFGGMSVANHPHT